MKLVTAFVCLVAVGAAAAAPQTPNKIEEVESRGSGRRGSGRNRGRSGAIGGGRNEKVADGDVELVEFHSNSDGQGHYEFGYEFDNGDKAQEEGTIDPDSPAPDGDIKTGFYEYIWGGQHVRVDYVSDKDGYRATTTVTDVDADPADPADADK